MNLFEMYKVKPLNKNKDIRPLLFENVKREEIQNGLKKITLMKDVLFKALFNNPDNLKPGAKFISLVTGEKYEDILANIRLCNNEVKKWESYDKASRVDYIAKIKDDYFQIEINNNQNIECIERNILYGYRIITTKSAGTELGYNGNLIQVNINNFALEDYNEAMQIIAPSFIGKEGRLFSKRIIFVHIFLPLLMKKYYNGDELDDLEKMIISLVLQDVNMASRVWSDKFMKELLDEQLHVSNTDNVYIPYDHEAETNKMYKEIGIEEGKEETYATVVKNLYANKLSLEMIAKATDLPIAKIKEILNLK